MQTPVSEVLKSKGGDVYAIDPGATVFDAIAVMADKGVGALVALTKTGKISGILSERDCFRKVILSEKSPRDVLVRDIMSRKVACVPPERTVEECLALMNEKKIRHLPVVQGDAVAGMISMRDLVSFLCSEQDLMIRNLEKYIEGSL
jgi:CBS domain-containing protein